MPTSEFAPFAKTGGLADVTAGLSDYLSRIGQDVRVFMPYYSNMKIDHDRVRRIEFIQNIEIPMGWRRIRFGLASMQVPGTDQWIYLVDCPELYHRGGLYTSDNDEHVRFGFFSRAVLESCQRMGWSPHIFHCNDWHTGMLPLYLRTQYGWDTLFQNSKTVLTIHNIGYQGVFSADSLHDLGLGDESHMLHQDDLRAGHINFMRTGLMYSDHLTTVSRTYAHELTTPEFGMGLHEDLRVRTDRLTGIVNGVDYGSWCPSSDPLIPAAYSRTERSGKKQNTETLLSSLGMAPSPSGPTLGVISRLTAQKGFELMYEPLVEALGALDIRLVALGSGEDRYEQYFRHLQGMFPHKVCFWHGYNNELAHRIEAGADIFLMPSRFEPCGLNQLYSLRYGTPPIVRRTGGLADTVEHWNPHAGTGTGFVFDHFTPQGFRWALTEALTAWQDQAGWQQLMRNGMAQDYGWDRQGREYLSLYARLSGD